MNRVSGLNRMSDFVSEYPLIPSPRLSGERARVRGFPSAFALLFMLTMVRPETSSAEPTRPNILFVFCDDLTCQALSTYGEKRRLLQTPNIDRIAREGMRFDRCLVTNSICGPSRATILTGKYSHLNGFYNNSNSRFDSSQVTFPKLRS